MKKGLGSSIVTTIFLLTELFLFFAFIFPAKIDNDGNPVGVVFSAFFLILFIICAVIYNTICSIVNIVFTILNISHGGPVIKVYNIITTLLFFAVMFLSIWKLFSLLS